MLTKDRKCDERGYSLDDSLDATLLLERWRAGDEQAAAELFRLYSQKLTFIAEQQLSQKIAARVDGEDIVQSAMRSFFRRGKRGDFRIDNSAGLWQLLVKITLAKAKSQARRHTSSKRDVAREQSTGSNSDDYWIPACEPTSYEAATLMEMIQLIVQGLPEKYAEILALRLAGDTRSEVAEKLGITRQTVYRALKTMQTRLKEIMPEIGETEES